MAGKSGRLTKPANLCDLERLNKNGGLWSMEITKVVKSASVLRIVKLKDFAKYTSSNVTDIKVLGSLL